MMARMKSVWASGRKKIFCTDWPMPRPKSPPEPSAIWPCTAWKPAPPAWLHGSRKVVSRARR